MECIAWLAHSASVSSLMTTTILGGCVQEAKVLPCKHVACLGCIKNWSQEGVRRVSRETEDVCCSEILPYNARLLRTG